MPESIVSGADLYAVSRGDGPALLLLHGFTGSGASWDHHVDVLASRFRTVTVDLIGHGRSAAPDDPERYRMDRCVVDLAAVLDRLGIGRAAGLGYSMGGRVALHLALAAPERVAALVLESASPGIADPAERAARVRADEELAAFIEREGIEAFVDRWERQPLFASQHRLPAATRQALRASRLANRPRGLANSLRGMGTGTMEPVHARLADLRLPVLLITGALDAKYVTLSHAMAEAMPDARLVIVPDAGHTVHLEQPEAFDAAVLDFLNAVLAERVAGWA